MRSKQVQGKRHKYLSSESLISLRRHFIVFFLLCISNSECTKHRQATSAVSPAFLVAAKVKSRTADSNNSKITTTSLSFAKMSCKRGERNNISIRSNGIILSGKEGKEDGEDSNFMMPSTDKLISDLKPSERGIGVGVDLGTTNSAIAILTDDGMPKLIPIEGKSTMPSVVSLLSSSASGMEFNEEEVMEIIGMEACRRSDSSEGGESAEGAAHGMKTYRNIKRIMGMGTTTAACSAEVVPHLVIRTASQRRKGRSLNKKNKIEGMASVGLNDMIKDAKKSPARLSVPDGYRFSLRNGASSSTGVREGGDGSDDDAAALIDEESTISPEEISALVLKKLFRTAEAAIPTGEKITRAVIGVPAYFNDIQREATITAAAMASNIPRERIRLLREPEAAALAYGIGKRQLGKGDDEELVLVFDLGGGTFDVSILEVGGGIMEVVATGGNNMLGGSDFDARIAQYMGKKMVEHGSSKNYWKEQGGAVANALVASAEQVRISLSNSRQVILGLPLTEEGWLNMDQPQDVILSGDEYDNVNEKGFATSSHAIFALTRKNMETLCLDEFLALLRPVREVAILAEALLPGDANPAAVEAVLQMEEEMELMMKNSNDMVEFDSFFDEESGEAKEDANDIDPDMLLQLKAYDLKNEKKAQQRGRKRARNLQKDGKKFRAEKRKADEAAKRQSKTGKGNDNNIKVRDGINGRRLTQVVLVGGATRMPAVGRLLAAVTGVVPQRTVNPDEAVALGCAVQVGVLDGNVGLGDLQVLTPIEAAMMRALARKRGLAIDDDSDGFDDDFDSEEYGVEEIF